MLSPFGSSTAQPGIGEIDVGLSPLKTSILRKLQYTYPLKLVSPDPRSDIPSILVFLLTYGGGLVAGDSVTLSIDIAQDSRLCLVTQGSTKLFKSPSRDVVSKQFLRVNVSVGGALCYLPDPTQPFKESVYKQKQIFNIEKEASICVLDWVNQGRKARGEKWNFWKWEGRNEVWALSTDDGKFSADRRLLLRDNVILDNELNDFSDGVSDRMDGLSIFGTLIIYGSLFNRLAEYFMAEYTRQPRIGAKDWVQDTTETHSSAEHQMRLERQAQEKRDGVLWTAASVRSLVLVKFGAIEMEGARRWLRSMLTQDGTIVHEFGEGSILCLK